MFFAALGIPFFFSIIFLSLHLEYRTFLIISTRQTAHSKQVCILVVRLVEGRDGTVELQRVNIKVIMSLLETNTDLYLCNTLPFIKIFMCFDPESKIQRLKWPPLFTGSILV